MDAVGIAARAIKAGEADLIVAAGVDCTSRAPFVMPKADTPFSRANSVHDTTIGWRFVNRLMKAQFGVDSMPETAENIAVDFAISRKDQDRFAAESQRRTAAAQTAGRFEVEIVPVAVAQKKGDPLIVRRRRTSARNQRRGACEAQTRGPPRRVGDRGQRLGSERRRGGPYRCQCRDGRALRSHPTRPRAGLRDSRRVSTHNGYWPRPGKVKADGAARSRDRRVRRG